MRLQLLLALGVFSLAACGSSTSPGPTGKAGSSGTAATGGTAGNLGPLGGAIATGGVIASAGGATGTRIGDAGAAGGSGGTSNGGTQPCTWLADCISTNNCSTQVCVEACTSQSTTAAIQQYTALIDCISTNAQCTTTDCLMLVCAGELAACKNTSVPFVDGGGQGLVDAGTQIDSGADASPTEAAPVSKRDAGIGAPEVGQVPDAPLGLDVFATVDAGIDGSGNNQGYMSSGSCDIVVKIPNLYDSHTCWDYTLTVTTNHNDGTEHYVAYTATDVSGTQSACTAQSYSASQPGPWNSASLSASNLSHKKQACDLAGSSYGTTSLWTEGGSCTIAGSLGHCTDAVTNAWDPATQILSSSLVGAWSVP